MGASVGICSCSKPEATLKGRSTTPSQARNTGREFILAAAASSFALAALNPEDRDQVLEAFQGPVFLDKGKELYRIGELVAEESPALYVLEKGSLEGIGGIEGTSTWKVFSVDTPGRVFGELASLYNEPRTETVVATSPSAIWFLDRLTFDLIVKQKAIEAYAANDNFLASIEIFGRLSAAERKRIADRLRPKICKAGETIIQMGDIGRDLIFLQAGSVHASKEGERVAEYQPPDYFGARALVFGEPRAANVIADTSPTKLAFLDEDSFRMLIPAEMRGDMTQLQVRS